jgi:hypothetical protein
VNSQAWLPYCGVRAHILNYLRTEGRFRRQENYEQESGKLNKARRLSLYAIGLHIPTQRWAQVRVGIHVDKWLES